MIYLLFLSIALILAALEAVSYPGFINNHLGFSAYLFYAASILSAVKLNRVYPKVHTLLKAGAYLSAVGVIIFSFLERCTYPNFVFSTFHLNLRTFQLFTGLFWFHYYLYSTFAKRINLSLVLSSLLIAVLVPTFAFGFGTTSAYVVQKILNISHAPLASYEEKLTNVYPQLYPAMQMVKDITPEDAKIYIPPQSNPWEYEGNAGIVRYFLYPRKIINLPANPPFPVFSNNDYLLISKGLWPELKGNYDYGWPKVVISAERTWRFQLEQGNFLTFEKDYDPRDLWEWGLIKPETNDD